MYLYDDSGLAAEEEFKEGLKYQSISEHADCSGIPFIYEKGGSVYTDISDTHTLIFGNTGSKKTRNFCIPGVYMMGLAGESMIISDPKGEIYNNTSGFLKKEDYCIKMINLRDSNVGNRWNPLSLPYWYYKAGMEDKALELITDFSMQMRAKIYKETDPYWAEIAQSLLEGMILMLFQCAKDEKDVHIGSLQRIRKFIMLENSDDDANIFWDFVKTFPANSVVRQKLQGIYALKNVDKTLMCVLSEYDSMMSKFYINQQLLSMMASSEINYDDLYKKKTVFYIIMPDEKRTFHFLVSVFVKQCYEYLIAQAQKQSGGKFERRINFILDEFSNLSQIKDMPSMISAGRSRNIRFTLIVQSRGQLYSLYDNEADIIKSNCRNWIFLASREIELLKEIEGLCGHVFVDGRGYVPVLSVSDLQRLTIGWEDSQALILCQQKKPYLSWVKDFSVYPQSKYPPAQVPAVVKDDISYFNLPDYLLEKMETDELVKKMQEKDYLIKLFDEDADNSSS